MVVLLEAALNDMRENCKNDRQTLTMDHCVSVDAIWPRWQLTVVWRTSFHCLSEVKWCATDIKGNTAFELI